MLEKPLESPLDCKEIQPVHSEGDQPWVFFGRNDAKAETPILWLPHEKSLLIGKDWCWEGLGAGRKGDYRGWDGWMASLTRWTWVWVNSRSWWWTGRPGVLQFMGSQRVGHDWETELNQTEVIGLYNIICIHSSVSGFLNYFHLWLLWTFAHRCAKRSSLCVQFFWVHLQKWSCYNICWFYVYFFEELLYSLPSQLYCFTLTLDCWVFCLTQGPNEKFLWTITFCLNQSLHLMVCWSNSWCLFRFLSFLGHFSEVFAK